MYDLKKTMFFMVFFAAYPAIAVMSLKERKEEAEKILSMEDNLDYSEKLFAQDNKEICLWFKNHKKALQIFLRKECDDDIKVKMMGSHRWKTNDLFSDIAAVIVTKSIYYEKIMSALGKYYQEHHKDAEQSISKTRASLHLFTLRNFTDETLSGMNLHYSIQTPEMNQEIIKVTEERMIEKFKNSSEKTLYALKMMDAIQKNDIEKQLELKKWTRVLSVKE